MKFPFSPRAQRQVEALLQHDFDLGRGVVRASPTPYPGLQDLSFRWLHLNAYWIAFVDEADSPRAIVGVVYDRADIPRRMSED